MTTSEEVEREFIPGQIRVGQLRRWTARRGWNGEYEIFLVISFHFDEVREESMFEVMYPKAGGVIEKCWEVDMVKCWETDDDYSVLISEPE
jgi:hypothetical protein